jgi:Tol biopolymer transport system component/DNA-binding winged helix-turn-helix (wHTH) protein
MPQTAVPARSKIGFGVFEADLESGELRKSGVRVRIQGQPFRLLALLLERPNEVVSREKIQQRLWGDRTNVDFDHSLGTAVNKLREALGDSAENPIFVETLARVGYRFIAPVRVEPPAEMEPPPVPRQEDPGTLALTVGTEASAAWASPQLPLLLLRRPAVLAGVAVLAVLCALFELLLLRTSAPAPSRISQLTYSGRVMSSLSDIESLSSTASDGARIYFSQVAEGAPILSEALIASGEISALGVPSAIASPMIGSISPDGSKLLVRNHLVPETEQTLWVLPTLGGDARRVANILAHDATWMPDGQHILYAFRHDLYVVKEDGTDNHKFASAPGRAFWLRWSPRGSSLRFTILDSADRSASLWEISASGKNLHPLLAGWTSPSNECCGSWTADGTRYVFQSSHGGGSNIWQLREPSWLPWTWLPSTRSPRLITNGPLDFSAPTTSREGQRIFFVGSNSRWEVRVFSPASRQFVPLQSNLASKSLVEYSPDGKWVAWLNAADGSLWKSRADGTERLQLIGPPFHIFRMKWSPRNDRLAVMAQRSGSPWKLYLVDAAGGGMQQVLNEERDEADPDWSADASSLVFGRVPDIMGGGKMPKAIYTVDLRTKQVTEVPGSSGLFSPRLSPDGRYIAAIRADQRALMVFDRSNARWTLLAEHGVGDPVWSRDSRTIYFQDFVEAGKPIYRVGVNDAHTLERVATVEDVRSADVLDYRLIGLAPNDMPLVTAQTSVVNLYSMSLDDH